MHDHDPLTDSSTNLDSWTLQQLRTLKVGGNASIAEFFTKHGGSSLLPPGNSDARGRYTSRAAGLYKEELAKRVGDDAQRWVAATWTFRGLPLGCAGLMKNQAL